MHRDEHGEGGTGEGSAGGRGISASSVFLRGGAVIPG